MSQEMKTPLADAMTPYMTSLSTPNVSTPPEGLNSRDLLLNSIYSCVTRFPGDYTVGLLAEHTEMSQAQVKDWFLDRRRGDMDKNIKIVIDRVMGRVNENDEDCKLFCERPQCEDPYCQNDSVPEQAIDLRKSVKNFSVEPMTPKDPTISSNALKPSLCEPQKKKLSLAELRFQRWKNKKRRTVSTAHCSWDLGKEFRSLYNCFTTAPSRFTLTITLYDGSFCI